MFILIGWYNARVKDARRLNPLGSILLYGFLVHSFMYPDCATYATLNNAPLSANFIIFIAGLCCKNKR